MSTRWSQQNTDKTKPLCFEGLQRSEENRESEGKQLPRLVLLVIFKVMTSVVHLIGQILEGEKKTNKQAASLCLLPSPLPGRGRLRSQQQPEVVLHPQQRHQHSGAAASGSGSQGLTSPEQVGPEGLPLVFSEAFWASYRLRLQQRAQHKSGPCQHQGGFSSWTAARSWLSSGQCGSSRVQLTGKQNDREVLRAGSGVSGVPHGARAVPAPYFPDSCS